RTDGPARSLRPTASNSIQGCPPATTPVVTNGEAFAQSDTAANVSPPAAATTTAPPSTPTLALSRDGTGTVPAETKSTVATAPAASGAPAASAVPPHAGGGAETVPSNPVKVDAPVAAPGWTTDPRTRSALEQSLPQLRDLLRTQG